MESRADRLARPAHGRAGAPEGAQQRHIGFAAALGVIQHHHQRREAEEVGKEDHLVLLGPGSLSQAYEEIEGVLELLLGDLRLTHERVEVAHQRVHELAQARIGRARHRLDTMAVTESAPFTTPCAKGSVTKINSEAGKLASHSGRKRRSTQNGGRLYGGLERRHGTLDAQGRREALPLEQESGGRNEADAERSSSCTARRWRRSPRSTSRCPGAPDSSAMDYFASLGYDTWTMDNEGYGRSDKNRPQNNDISNGADDLAAGSQYILEKTGREEAPRLRHLVGRPASGPVRTAPSRARGAPRARRVRVDAARAARRSSERKKKLPQFINVNRRPIDRTFVQSIFERDHPGTADEATIDAFADAILALDDSVPTGTYVDMCSKLPLVDPAKLTVPTIIMRGEFDGIAGFDDLVEFFKRLPNADKQFAVMAGHLARELPAEELPSGLPHPARLLPQPEPAYRA